MVKRKITFASVLKNLDAVITCVTLSICVVLVNVNVILRYIIKKPIPGCEEIVTGFFVWTVFIGCAYAHRTHSHLGVDILVNLMPSALKKLTEIIVLILELCILILVTYISGEYVYHLIFSASGAFKPVLTDVLRFPKWYIGIAVPIGFGLCTIFSVVEILRDRLHIFRGKPADGGHTTEQGGAV